MDRLSGMEIPKEVREFHALPPFLPYLSSHMVQSMFLMKIIYFYTLYLSYRYSKIVKINHISNPLYYYNGNY